MSHASREGRVERGELRAKSASARLSTLDPPTAAVGQLSTSLERSAVGSVCIAFASGCPQAEMDTSVLFRYFRTNGWRIEEAVHRADLFVVSACGVDPHAEKRNLHLLKIADKRQGRFAAVRAGVLAGISASRLLDQLDAELFPPSKLDTLDAMIGAGVPIRQIADVNQIDADLRRARRCFGMWTRLKTQVAFSWGFRQKAAWA